MSSFSTRLVRAMAEKNIKQVSLVNAGLGSKGTISNWYSGKSMPDAETVGKVASFLGVNTHWLSTGQGEMTDPIQAYINSLPSAITHEEALEQGRDSVLVDVYDVNLCCGDGDKVEFEPLKKQLPFDRSFFTKRNLKPANFKLIYAKGDSMADYIQAGDAVGIDTSRTDIKDGEIYAVYLDGDSMIKRVFVEGNGVLRLASSNPIYKDKMVTHSENFGIIGRVVYRSG